MHNNRGGGCYYAGKISRDDPFADMGMPRKKAPKEMDGAAIKAL
jgi:hypothetical protein